MSGIIELKDIYKTFTHNGKSFNAVENASVSINKGEFMELSDFREPESLLWFALLIFWDGLLPEV